MKKIFLYITIFFFIFLFLYTPSLFADNNIKIAFFDIYNSSSLDNDTINTFSSLLINEFINKTPYKIIYGSQLSNLFNKNNDLKNKSFYIDNPDFYSFLISNKKYLINKIDYAIFGKAFFDNGIIIITLSIFDVKNEKIVDTITESDSIDFILFTGNDSLLKNISKKLSLKFNKIIKKSLILTYLKNIEKFTLISPYFSYIYSYDYYLDNNISSAETGINLSFTYPLNNIISKSKIDIYTQISPQYEYDKDIYYNFYNIFFYSYQDFNYILNPYFNIILSCSYKFSLLNYKFDSTITIANESLHQYTITTYSSNNFNLNLKLNYTFYDVFNITNSSLNTGIDNKIEFYNQGILENKEYFENVAPDLTSFSKYPVINVFSTFPVSYKIKPYINFYIKLKNNTFNELIFNFNLSFLYTILNNLSLYENNNIFLPFFSNTLILNSFIKIDINYFYLKINFAYNIIKKVESSNDDFLINLYAGIKF